MEIIISSPEGGEERCLPFTGEEMTIGRDADSDIALDSNAVSRRHAKLELREGRVRVTDLSSTNGTWVDGVMIRSPRDLGPGEKVSIGGFCLSFRVPAPGEGMTGEKTEVFFPLALEIIAPGKERRPFCLRQGGEALLGRRADCAIRLDDPSVSARHAVFFARDGQVLVRDLDSTNGTRLNNRAVVGEQVLRDGDALEFGRVKGRIRLPAAASACPPSSGRGAARRHPGRRRAGKRRPLLLLALVIAAAALLALVEMRPQENRPGESGDEYREGLAAAVSLFSDGPRDRALSVFRTLAGEHPSETGHLDYLEALERLDDLERRVKGFSRDIPSPTWAEREQVMDIIRETLTAGEFPLVRDHPAYGRLLEKTLLPILEICAGRVDQTGAEAVGEALDICRALAGYDIPGHLAQRRLATEQRLEQRLAELRTPPPAPRPPPPSPRPADSDRAAGNFLERGRVLFDAGRGEEARAELNRISAQGVSTPLLAEIAGEKRLVDEVLREWGESRHREVMALLADRPGNRYYQLAAAGIHEADQSRRGRSEARQEAVRLHAEAEVIFTRGDGPGALSKLTEAEAAYSLGEINRLRSRITDVLSALDEAGQAERAGKLQDAIRLYARLVEMLPETNAYHRRARERTRHIQAEQARAQEEERIRLAREKYARAREKWRSGGFSRSPDDTWNSGRSRVLPEIRGLLDEAAQIMTLPELPGFRAEVDAAISAVEDRQRGLYLRAYARAPGFPAQALEICREIVEKGIPGTDYYRRAAAMIAELQKRPADQDFPPVR